MKTPHTIILQRGEQSEPIYNPVTDEYEDGEVEEVGVPCLVNKVTQATTFEQYGNRQDVVIIARFNQEQEPFHTAFFNGDRYKPIEAIDAPIKGSVRLRKAGVADG